MKQKYKIFAHTEPGILEDQINKWLKGWGDQIKILETILNCTTIHDSEGELLMRTIVIRYSEKNT